MQKERSPVFPHSDQNDWKQRTYMLPYAYMDSFEWDANKNKENQEKHGVSFEQAQYAFSDPDRLILVDDRHSTPEESRFFCVGRVDNGILTVRFTYRANQIRIYGAGRWRKYRKLYLQQEDI